MGCTQSQNIYPGMPPRKWGEAFPEPCIHVEQVWCFRAPPQPLPNLPPLACVCLNEAMQCAICFENQEVGSEVSKLCCGHDFCKSCIGNWLVKQSCCPLCRRSMVHEFDVEIDCAEGFFGVWGHFVHGGFGISCVESGPLREWNVKAGTDMFRHVMAGDIIVDINGESASHFDVFRDAANRREMMNLKIRRPAQLSWALELDE